MKAVNSLPSRSKVFSELSSKLATKPLHEYAESFGISRMHQGHLNKGWAGLTLERLSGLSNSNLAEPDGADFEMKSTRVVPTKAGWAARETIKITSMNPAHVLEQNFCDSILAAKLRHWIFIGCYYPDAIHAEAVLIGELDVLSFSFAAEIESFWNDLRDLIATGEMASHPNLGQSHDWIQLRPTGDGKGKSLCPVSGRRFPARAFYATKRLLGELIPHTTTLRFSAQSV